MITVREMFAMYAHDLAKRGKGQRYRTETLWRAERYLGPIIARPIDTLSKRQIIQLHDQLPKRAGNQVFKAFTTAWKLAERKLDATLPPCPTVAITYNPESAKVYEFSWPHFWREVAAATPQRRLVWTLGVLTGLRPGNLMALRQEWCTLDRITIPRRHMKVSRGRPDFVVPLAGPARAVLADALVLAKVCAPGSPYVFPSRQGKPLGTVRPFGHVLRHQYRTAAMAAGVPADIAAVLMDHAIPGMADIYVQRSNLDFAALLEAQERVAAYILATRT